MPVPSLKTDSYCLPLRGRKKKKFLIKGGHYTSEDILSITSHYQQPIAAKMLPCKCEKALAQRCAAVRPAKIPAGRGRQEPGPRSLVLLWTSIAHCRVNTARPQTRRDGDGLLLASSAFWGPNSAGFSISQAILPSPHPQKYLWAVLNKQLLRTWHPCFSPHMHVSVSWKADSRGTHGLCLRSPVSAIPWSCPACWNMVTYANIISQL